jgi:Undecaprenyl-phosphate galactose phosphotransferase WbaP
MANNNQAVKKKTALQENRSPVVNIVLILVDVLTISFAVILAATIRWLLEPIMGGHVNWPLVFRGLIYFMVFNLLLAWLNGLYPGFGLPAVHEMQKVLYVVSLATIFLGVFLFLQQLALAYSRMIFLMTWFFSVLFMMLGRFAIRNVFSRFDWWGIPIAVIGSQDIAAPVIDKMIQDRRLGFRPACFFDPQDAKAQPPFNVPVVETKDSLVDFVRRSSIQHVIVTDSIEDIMNLNIHWMRDVFPNILFVLQTSPLGSLWVRTIDLHGTLVVETNYHLLNKRQIIFKRILDLIITLSLLLVSWPLFLVLAVLIKLDSKGPVVFKQERLGQDGQLFDSLKFRTMYENAEEKLVHLMEEDPEARREYEEYHKLTNDPRITRVGKFLRRYSLDELPQIINILKGDMNLIGPRSYLPRELPEIGDYAAIILKVKPGMTGWWQVMGRNATTFEERLKLDEYYISNWSIWLDIYIVIKTFWVLLSGQGL